MAGRRVASDQQTEAARDEPHSSPESRTAGVAGPVGPGRSRPTRARGRPAWLNAKAHIASALIVQRIAGRDTNSGMAVAGALLPDAIDKTLAYVLHRAGDDEDARRACEEALRIDPNYVAARQLLAELNR